LVSKRSEVSEVKGLKIIKYLAIAVTLLLSAKWRQLIERELLPAKKVFKGK